MSQQALTQHIEILHSTHQVPLLSPSGVGDFYLDVTAGPLCPAVSRVAQLCDGGAARMCGIDLFVRRLGAVPGDCSPVPVDPAIQRRGPDSLGHWREQVGETWELLFTSTVLHLRGEQNVHQPLVSDRYILQWNGEVYAGLDVGCGDLMLVNDTQLLFAFLHQHQSDIIPHLFSQLQGEYAFTLFDRFAGRLYYGRDFFGRRSLAVSTPHSSPAPTLLHLSSVVPAISQGHDTSQYEEVPARGIWVADLLDQPNLSITLIPWSLEGPLLSPLPQINVHPPVQHPLDMDMVLSQTLSALEQSLARRLLCLPNLHAPGAAAPTVGILFSGGIDSGLLAALSDRVLPAGVLIDLINVSFQNRRVARARGWTEFNYEDAPDRISGRAALAELIRLAPQRQWRFIAVNVPEEQYAAERTRVISLMRPSDTVMDLSIAIALWFAASGRGCDGGPHSDARVLLVGMGADEQFGGYSRHRVAFEREGRAGVLHEIQLEMERISSRNLGRDDRCISDHGKEARFPFLDESFVAFASRLPLEAKCDFSLARGVGEKRLLRLMGQRLGFSDAIAFAPKRAIQFGAKTAKMHSSTETGTDRLLSA